jgi:dTDP-4-dehydrorhamnose 3,5-epimerase
MHFVPLDIPGVFSVEPEKREDSRGMFARTYCAREFAAHGLDGTIAQCNVSYNARRGTLRGLHFQIAPYEEAKLVRVTAGAVYDVIVDLRPDSPAYLRWMWQELTAASHRALYVPKGCAHGFLTLTDGVEMLYHMSEFFEAAHNTGVRWNDPAFRVEWPFEPLIVSDKDAGYPDYQPVR